MVQTELPLYPKISSIYNKIMQLAIAIVLIILVMNIWLASDTKTQKVINQQFVNIGQNNTENIAATIAILLTVKSDVQNNTLLKQYIKSLTRSVFIDDVRFYDQSGQLLVASEHSITIRELYGIDDYKINRSDKLTAFVSEVRQQKNHQLQGYIRVITKKSSVTQALVDDNKEKRQLKRLMLMMAGVIGFLLTRGLNRFSRQGFRLASQLK
jgi:membrane protein